MASSANGADTTALSELGLPGWLEDMLKPGVGAGVFATLKASLVGLVFTQTQTTKALTKARQRFRLDVTQAVAPLPSGRR